ncbi:hypothetical protein TWF481_009300 [Arthrobotrys musiformis]|uniref:Uncharacterized protein n=1 Tax=Arthrobotrys musiformis TaxID=47236 RepID=A0AAV9W5H6_9PEZI
MALIVSPTNYFQTVDGRSSRLRLASDLDQSMVLSRRVQPYKCSEQMGRLPVSNSPSGFPLTSSHFSPPPSFKTSEPLEEYNSSPRKHRKSKSRRNSESIPRIDFERWQTGGEGLENCLENLALARTPKRSSGKSRDSYNKDFSAEGFDHRNSNPPALSDLAVPLGASDWDNAVAIYKTAPSHGQSDSNGSSGVSRQSDKSGRRNRQVYGSSGYGDFTPGGRGGAGGDDEEPPSLPQPIEPPASDGKKYYACWFWLHDPVRYHSCGDIRKEAHHLKHVHLPKHFPNGLPPTLRHRMNYDAVWYALFPRDELPGVKDRDERLLDMARQYRPSAQLPPVSTAIVSRGDSAALLSPEIAARYRSGTGEGSSRRQSIQLPQSRARRHSVSNNRPTSRYGSSSTGGRSTRDSSSNAGSHFDPNYDYLTPPQIAAYAYNEECNLIPDADNVPNSVAMFLEYDGRAAMSPSDRMEIDNMTRRISFFNPRNPRIKVVDLNETYFWDERHLDTEFDFQNHSLMHFSDRISGAGMLISMDSMEVLQREYYSNMAPRASTDGYVTVQKVYRWPS